MGRHPLELARGFSHVALASHHTRSSRPFGVTIDAHATINTCVCEVSGWPLRSTCDASQRSLHSTPIFRLLLKVAVNGTHQCDFSNFARPNGPNCRLSTRSHDPYHTDGTIHSCWPTVATSCTPHIRSHCMRRVTPRFLAVRLSSCLRLQRLCMRRMHPMMPGLDNHLVGLHRELSCYHSRNCSWRALPIRGVCWPRAGVRRGGEHLSWQ